MIQCAAVLPRFDQCLAIVEFDPVEPFERQHPPRGPAPIDLRHVITGLGDHVLPELGRRRGLSLEVELSRGPLLELRNNEPRPKPRRLAAEILDMCRRPFIGFDRPGELFLDPRSKNLDGDIAAIGCDRAVDLCDRSGPDRFLVEPGKQAVERRVK